MKTSKDPRHIERVRTMQELFSVEFSGKRERDLSAYSQEILAKKGELDNFIQQAAPEWPIEKINRIDLSVLRLALYELFYSKKAPTKVVVDEAVEIAKEYGSESSGSFVNGVLGTLIDSNPDKLH